MPIPPLPTIKVLSDNGSILFDAAKGKVLVEPECHYEISFSANISSNEYVPGYYAHLFYGGSGITVDLKEEGGALGWVTPGGFMATIDPDHYFDTWHLYVLFLRYDDASNSWFLEVNIDGQDIIGSCSPPQYQPFWMLRAGQVTSGSAAMSDRRLTDVSFTLAHNNLNFPGDPLGGPNVDYEGNDLVYFNPDPAGECNVGHTFDTMKSVCCFRNVKEINQIDASCSGNGTGHFERCCCGEDVTDPNEGFPLCGSRYPECTGCCPGDPGGCPPFCGSCDAGLPCGNWPPGCDPCIEGSCTSEGCCQDCIYTQDVTHSVSGHMGGLPVTRIDYDDDWNEDGLDPAPGQFKLWWGTGTGDLSPYACSLYQENSSWNVTSVFNNDPSGFHNHDCQDCSFDNDAGGECSAFVYFDFDQPPFSGWGAMRGEGDITLQATGICLIEHTRYLDCMQPHVIHFTNFDLTPVKEASYHCANSLTYYDDYNGGQPYTCTFFGAGSVSMDTEPIIS